MIAHCPSCNYKKEIPNGSYGKTAKCSKCGTVFTIQQGNSAPVRSSNTAVIILSVVSVLLAAGLAFVLLSPEDTTQFDRAEKLQRRVDQLKSKLDESEEALAAKSREAAEAVGNLAGVKSMLEAKSESLDRAEATIEDLNLRLKKPENSNPDTATASPEAIAELEKEVARLRRELDQAQKSAPTPEPAESAPLSPPPGVTTSSSEPAPGPPLKEMTGPEHALEPGGKSELAAADTTFPEQDASEPGMPGGLMKLRRERPELFDPQMVRTDQGIMPLRAFHTMNVQRKKDGRPLLVIIEENMVEENAPVASQAPAPSLEPGVKAPQEIQDARGNSDDAPSPMPPGIKPGFEPAKAEESNGPAAASPLRTVNQTINVRSGRTTDSDVVFKLRPGQAVRLGFFKDNWYAVFKPDADTSNESGALGYVYGPLFDK